MSTPKDTARRFLDDVRTRWHYFSHLISLPPVPLRSPNRERAFKELFRSLSQLLLSDSTTKFPSQTELLTRIRTILNLDRLWDRFKRLLPTNLSSLNPTARNEVEFVFTGDEAPERIWTLELSHRSDLFERPAFPTDVGVVCDEESGKWTIVRARKVPPELDGDSNYLKAAKDKLGREQFSSFVELIRRFQNPKKNFNFEEMFKEVASRLKQYPELIFGFGQFVTEEQAIRLNELADNICPVGSPFYPQCVYLQRGVLKQMAQQKRKPRREGAKDKVRKRKRESSSEEKEEAPKLTKRSRKVEVVEKESSSESETPPIKESLKKSKELSRSGQLPKQAPAESSENDSDFESAKPKRNGENQESLKRSQENGDGQGEAKRPRLQRAAADAAIVRMRIFDNDYDLTLLKPDQCERLSPSYIVLPEYAKRFHSTAVDDLGSEVLNSTLYLSPPKATSRQEEQYMNPHAEVLSMLEQDMMEMDLLIDRARSTLDRVQTIVRPFPVQYASAGLVGSPNYNEDDFDLDLVLGPVHRHTIKQLYGRLGIEKVDLLVTTPSAVVPEVIAAIKSKLTEYYDSKNKFTEKWRNVFRGHYPSSLNDRGGFFKKKDIANRQPIAEWELMFDSFVAELKKAKFASKGLNCVDSQTDQKFDLTFSLGKHETIEYVFELVVEVASHILDGKELDKVCTFAEKFATLFFGFTRENSKRIFKTLGTLNIQDSFQMKQPINCNVNILAILRLIQIAVERLDSSAQFIYFESTKFDWNRVHRPVPDPETTISYTSESDKLINTEGVMKESFKMSDEVIRDPRLKVAEHRELLRSIFAKGTSSDEYEERTIRLFGLQSYTLFGLDHLLVQLSRLFVELRDDEELHNLFDDYLSSGGQSSKSTGSSSDKRALLDAPGDIRALEFEAFTTRDKLCLKLNA